MKDLQEDNLFGSIRRRLGRYEEAPSGELWSRIAATQKRRRAAAWPVLIGAVSIIGIGAFFLLDSDKEQVREKKEAVKEVVKDNVVVERENSAFESPVAVTEEHHRSIKDISDAPVVSFGHEQTIQVASGSPIENNESQETATDSVAPLPVVIKIPDETVPPFKRPNSKFQLYLSLTPSLSFQKIIPTGDDAIIIQGLANRSPFSLKRFGFAIDAGLQYDIDKIFGVYGGLSFYRQQQQLTYNYYNNDAQVTRTGDAWTFQIDRPQQSQTFDYTMTNIGARTGLLVTLKGEKLKHKFGAGVAYSHGFAKATGAYNNRQSSYIAYQVFYRNEIRINETFSWFVEPVFNYSFISKEKLDEPFRLKPYRAGISGGVLYRFR
jgi:hypothetical protein